MSIILQRNTAKTRILASECKTFGFKLCLRGIVPALGAPNDSTHISLDGGYLGPAYGYVKGGLAEILKANILHGAMIVLPQILTYILVINYKVEG